MSLFETFKVPCTLMEKVRVSDGEGGWTKTWTEGASFKAAIVLDSTINARIAEHDGMTGVFTVTTDPNVTLEFHDAFKRKSDGKTFRVTKVNDSTPNVATFSFNQYQAEEWVLD
jgi:Phage head-tail joining protein.